MAFVEKGREYGYDQLLSGTGHKIMEIVVPSGKSVKRGHAVSSACDLSDGTDLFGIVLEDADGTKTATKTAVVVFGEVLYEALTLKSETQKAAFITSARDKGIIVKELGGK